MATFETRKTRNKLSLRALQFFEKRKCVFWVRKDKIATAKIVVARTHNEIPAFLFSENPKCPVDQEPDEPAHKRAIEPDKLKVPPDG